MKNLILIRHAKSSWDDPSLNDSERPLNKRGKTDAPIMGRLLKEKSLLPELMVSSPAKRALKTASRIAKEIGYPKERIEIKEELYLKGTGAIVELIRRLDDGQGRVFLFGHNPDLTELANLLTGANLDNIPTCGVVSITFPFDTWQETAEGTGSLALFERPPKPQAPDL